MALDAVSTNFTVITVPGLTDGDRAGEWGKRNSRWLSQPNDISILFRFRLALNPHFHCWWRKVAIASNTLASKHILHRKKLEEFKLSNFTPIRALTVRLAVGSGPRSNGGWSWCTMATEKTVSVKGSWTAERGRETESHDLPERAVKPNLCVLEKPPSVENNITFELCEYTHMHGCPVR